jgi:ubiquitin carboxyl-terminal hydrolase 4/11/15
MSGDGDFQRSSSPLKRRASSMDPEPNEDDVDMVAPAHQPNGIASSSADLPRADLPRAMSVDPDGGPGYRENADASMAQPLSLLRCGLRSANLTFCQSLQ